MKRSLLFIGVLSFFLILCGCSQNTDTEDSLDISTTQMYETSDGNLAYENNFKEVSQGSLIERNGNQKQVSAPDGSIEFDEVIKTLDLCSFEELYLPQSVDNYKKYYSDTVTYDGTLYYSIDLYIEANGKRAFVGTNCLVACDGSQVLKKTWTGDYLPTQLNASSSDKTYSELYGDTDVTPNDALSNLISLSESKLGFEHNLLSYTFEIDTKFFDIENVKCYRITPKLNYTNSVSMLSPYYVAADGSDKIFIKDTKNIGSYIELK